MTAIQDMSAGELLAAYKAKKLSPVEAVDAIIARIEAWEPKLKALYAPDFEGARKMMRTMMGGKRMPGMMKMPAGAPKNKQR